MITLKGIDAKVRQIAIRNIGRDEPTLLITNELTAPAKDLFARYAERMLIENELDAYLGGFHLDALSSAVPLNVDLDTTLTVLAGNLYRLLARQLPRYATRHPGHHLAPLPRHRRHPAHHQRSHHLRAQPAQPPPRTHRRRLRRPQHRHPLVERPHPALPLPTPMTKPRGPTSTQLPHRESRLRPPGSAGHPPVGQGDFVVARRLAHNTPSAPRFTNGRSAASPEAAGRVNSTTARSPPGKATTPPCGP